MQKHKNRCDICGAELPNLDERCDCGLLTAKTDMDVLYLCDRRQCDVCHYPTCKHTKDISHAINFEVAFYGKNIFIEKEPQ